MFARNVQWAALLLFAFAVYTSCSRQDELADEVARGEEIVTTVGVNVPQVFKTRTAMLNDVYAGEGERYLGTSGMPSIGNVDLKQHPLTFTVGVYIKKKQGTDGYDLVARQSHTAEDDNAYFEFRLLKDQKYRLVAYADFKGGGEKGDLESISYTTALNDEYSDAFFASEDFVAKENIQVVLKRPFGKLRLVAHDFNTLAAGEAFKINKVTVKYYRAPMLATNTFNALTGEFNYDETAQGDHTVEAVPVVYTREYTDEGKAAVVDGKEAPIAVFTMYLPANYGDGGPLKDDTTPGLNPDPDHVDENAVPQSWFYPFDVIVEYENANGGTTGVKTIERSYTIDIPVKRNWLTTVDATHFWTGKSGVMVTVHAAFDGEIKVGEEKQETINNAAELQDAIKNICLAAPKGETTVAKIVLGEDIDVSALSGGVLMFDTYTYGKDDVNRTVEIYLDLNNHTIYSSKENPTPKSAKGLVSIYSRNTILHIDDTSKDANGGIEYRGTNPDAGYPLISCVYGGQVVINRGTFVSTTANPVVYVYESESQRAAAQIEVLKALGWTPQNCPEEKPNFTDEQKKTIEAVLKRLTATATINGGWFENATNSSTEDTKRCVINNYNVTPGNANSNWGKYHNWAVKKGYPAWTDWGNYVNQCFGFVHVNGGSFVEQDPSKGDNIVGNNPNEWIGNGHVQTEVVDGKTVYTVIPEKVEHEF